MSYISIQSHTITYTYTVTHAHSQPDTELHGHTHTYILTHRVTRARTHKETHTDHAYKQSDTRTNTGFNIVVEI